MLSFQHQIWNSVFWLSQEKLESPQKQRKTNIECGLSLFSTKFRLTNQKKLKRLILIEDDVEIWYNGERFFQLQVKKEWRGTGKKRTPSGICMRRACTPAQLADKTALFENFDMTFTINIWAMCMIGCSSWKTRQCFLAFIFIKIRIIRAGGRSGQG